VLIYDRVLSTSEIARVYGQVHGAMPTSGLVAWYRGSGDGTSNKNDLAVAGNVSTTTDRFGNANAASLFAPSGSGDATTAISGNNPLLPVGTAARTVSVWLQTSTNYTSWGTGDFWNWGTNAIGERFGEVVVNNDTEYFVGQFSDKDGTVHVNDGDWHNVIVTYDGTTTTQYVDGVLDVTATLVLNTTGTSLVIGNALHDHTQEPFNGALDDVLIYDRVLSTSELRQVYESSL